MNLSIKHWPEQERPRERLLQQGANSLSDAELLAIFLRSGSQQHSAVELARLLIQHFGGLAPILNAELPQLSQFHGIGASKYSQLMVIKELGRLSVAQQLQQHSLEIQNSSQLLDYLRFELLGETQEVFAVLCLDSQLRKLHFKKLFFGSLNSCTVSLNQLLRYALQQQASSIVIANNHPLGHALPSAADIALTQQITQACKLLEIQLLDHCVIAATGSFSFAEQGLIKST